MREILFRGKRTDNGEWVKGYLYITHTGAHEIGSYDAEINIERFTFDVIPETVGQFTGHTDKNKCKAFEGDILSHCGGSDYGVIRYGEYSSPFSIGQDKGYRILCGMAMRRG